MQTTQERPRSKEQRRPLVFRLRQMREWAERDGLTQADLALIAGISARALRAYEAHRALPRSVSVLLRLAMALRVPVEFLIAPKLLTELRAPLETHRAIVEARRKRPKSGRHHGGGA